MDKIGVGAAGAALALGALVLAGEGTAAADPSWSDPDGNPHSWCRGANMAQWEVDRVHAQMLWNEQNTDMNRSFDDPCDFSSPMTDMHVMNVDLPAAGVRGEASCTAWHGWWECDRYDVKYDKGEILQQAQDFSVPFRPNLAKTLCHEIGHTLSLEHYEKASPPEGQHDCMISGVVNDNPAWQTIGEHHRNDHVNNQF